MSAQTARGALRFLQALRSLVGRGSCVSTEMRMSGMRARPEVLARALPSFAQRVEAAVAETAPTSGPAEYGSVARAAQLIRNGESETTVMRHLEQAYVAHASREWLVGKHAEAAAAATGPTAGVSPAEVLFPTPSPRLSNPAQWYPKARKLKRKVIMHVGPTNLGKTYHALKRLEQATTGYYAGPLRLLGREIYERLKHKGLRCNLITGEEILIDIDRYGNPAGISLGTIEMINTSHPMEVCVLDEIQMIADESRGWAWTHAFLGVVAREVHLCGEDLAVDLITELVRSTGDELEIKRYERLGPLEVVAPLRGKHTVQQGDALVAFLKRKILMFKQDIEEKTSLKCAVIYGALPAETRKAQSDGFNSGKYQVLVATDAVGMGLNLAIKRMVFTTTTKWNGSGSVDIPVPQIKQIAGRAGRYRVAPLGGTDSADSSNGAAAGFVTAMNHTDTKAIAKALGEPTTHLLKAVLWPMDTIWAHYMLQLPHDTSLQQTLRAFGQGLQEQVPHYEMNVLPTQLDIAANVDLVHERQREDRTYTQLLVGDRLRMLTAPVNVSASAPGAEQFINLFRNFLATIARGHTTNVLSYRELPIAILDQRPLGLEEALNKLELVHKGIQLFLWFSYRYPTMFVDREGATDLKALAEKRLLEELDVLKIVKYDAKYRGGKRGSRSKQRQKPA